MWRSHKRHLCRSRWAWLVILDAKVWFRDDVLSPRDARPSSSRGDLGRAELEMTVSQHLKIFNMAVDRLLLW